MVEVACDLLDYKWALWRENNNGRKDRAFYLVSDSILSYLYGVSHCILTTTSQGRALSWNTEAETRISTVKECILLKVLDSSVHKREFILQCLRIGDSQSLMLLSSGS